MFFYCRSNRYDNSYLLIMIQKINKTYDHLLTIVTNSNEMTNQLVPSSVYVQYCIYCIIVVQAAQDLRKGGNACHQWLETSGQF